MLSSQSGLLVVADVSIRIAASLARRGPWDSKPGRSLQSHHCYIHTYIHTNKHGNEYIYIKFNSHITPTLLCVYVCVYICKI